MTRWTEKIRALQLSQQTAAICVILVQAFTLALLMDALVFPVCAALLACAGPAARRAGWTISLPGDRWVLFLAAMFIAKYSFAPREFNFQYGFLFSEFAYEVASFCIVVELIHLYRRQNEKKLPVSFLGFAVVGLIFTGDVRLNPTRRVLMLLAVQFFFMAWLWFALRSRREVQDGRRHSTRWRTAVMLGVLTLSMLTGTAAAILIHYNERTLEDLIAAYLSIGENNPARSGFSNRGGLSDVSNWKDFGEDEVALRVRSELVPGYLRGKVFTEFNVHRWTTTDNRFSISPTPIGTKVDQIGNWGYFYRLDDTFPEQYDVLDIWPVDAETAAHCFAPLETVGIRCHSTPLSLDQNRIMIRPNEKEVAPYQLLTARKIPHTPLQDASEFLQVPHDLDERVIRAADELLSHLTTTNEKIHTVRQFFQQNFQYHLGVEIPRKEDRLGYFLEHRLPAHCEYFATATVLFLRLHGVPARYVTGFVVQEMNEIDGNWVARRRDAHAWVEAYDPKQERWVLVESTPADGIPAPKPTEVWQQRREAIRHFMRSIQELVKRGAYFEAIWRFAEPFIWLISVGGLLAFGLYAVTRYRFQKQIQQQSFSMEGPAELIHEREQMDQFVSRLGLQRASGETVTQFARRIVSDLDDLQAENVANWYRAYSQIRFRPGHQDADIEVLRQDRLRLLSQEEMTKQGTSNNA